MFNTAHCAPALPQAARKRIAANRARPGGATPPASEALVGWYAHPAYGNCSISVQAPGGRLQVGNCATIWQTNNTVPWMPATGTLEHLYFGTYAVVGQHLDVGAGTPMITFYSTRGDGIYDRFESPLESHVAPIVFAKAGYCGQGIGWSSAGPSKAFEAGTGPYNWPLPRPEVYV